MTIVGRVAPRAGRAMSSGRVDGVLDQGLSSISNLLLALLVARFASVRDFGVFAVVSAMYWLFLGVNRSLVGEPRLVIEGDVPSRRAALDLYASGCVAVVASGVFL